MILILGASGYMGQAFAAELRRRGQAFEPLSRQQLDYTRFDLLFNHVRSRKPRLVINASGFTGGGDVGRCEQARADAVHANTLLPQTIARVCYLTKTPWAHISSGSIFAGAKLGATGEAPQVQRDMEASAVAELLETAPERFSGFSEQDAPNCTFNSPPCSFYTGTKGLGEESLRWFDQGYVWRPGPVFDDSDHPRNALPALLQLPADRFAGSLSHRADFVKASLDLWEARAPFGIYHIVNPGFLTAAQRVDLFRKLGHSPSLMDPQTARETGFCPPIAGSILDSSRLQSFGIKMRNVTDALQESARANTCPTAPSN